MRLFIILLFFLIGRLPAIAQCDTSLTGKWKIAAIFNGEVYINLRTDSSFLTDEMKRLYPTKTAQKQLIEDAKYIYSETKFDFTKNGDLIFTMSSVVNDTSKYCYNAYQHNLRITSKNSDNQDVTDITPAKFLNGLLHFNYKWGTAVYEVDLEKSD